MTYWGVAAGLAAIVLCSTIMEAQSYPSREALSVLSDGEFTEMYVASVNGRTREINSDQFFEPRPDLGEVRFLKRANCEVQAPDKARPFIATSGLLKGKLDAFWLGWWVADSVSALSVYQQEPIRVELKSGDVAVSQPIIMPNKKLYYYFWRAVALCRLEFSGEFGQRGKAETVEIANEKSAPALSASRAVPGSTEDRSVVGVVESVDDAIVPGVLFVTGKSVTRVVAKPLAGYAPLPRQHLGMHQDDEGVVTVGFVAQHAKSKTYAVIEANCNPVAGCRLETSPLTNVAPGALHSAAVIYYERRAPRLRFVLLLDTSGKLWMFCADNYRLLRSGVDPGYSFPVLTTIGGRYEAAFNNKGGVELRPLE